MTIFIRVDKMGKGFDRRTTYLRRFDKGKKFRFRDHSNRNKTKKEEE